MRRSFVRPSAPADRAERSDLRCEGVSKSFGGVAAVKDVDCVVRSGEILAIIGPNGAGKSSLINVMSGLYRPTAGRVCLDGQDLGRKSLAARSRAGIMRTFQGTHVFSSLTVKQALLLGREAPRAVASDESVEDFADSFGLGGYLDNGVLDLPYGMQKVLNLALVSASQPRVLLLDEPFAGVHIDEVERLSSAILRFREQRVAIALVEHNIEALLRIADRVAVLDAGVLIFEGGPKAARSSTAVQEAYLGKPVAIAGGVV